MSWRGEDVGHGPWICEVEDWIYEVQPAEGWTFKETRYRFETETEAWAKRDLVETEARRTGKRIVARVRKE